jgi:LPXTG-motif cell wall-anchored protein
MADVAVVQVSIIGSRPAVKPPVSVLPDTGGPPWMALAAGVLLVIGGILARWVIKR